MARRRLRRKTRRTYGLSKAAKAKRRKAREAKAKKAPAPKKKAATKKAPTKKAAVKRREPVKAAPPKRAPIKREASVIRQTGGPRDLARRQNERLGAQQRAEAEAQRASLMRPREAAEDFGGKRAPITGKERTDVVPPGKGSLLQETQSTEDLLRQYNESQGAKDHGLSVTFDEETGEYVEDLSAFGFEGDQATKRYSPEEFQKKMGGGSEAAVEEAVQETAQESEQQAPSPEDRVEFISHAQ